MLFQSSKILLKFNSLSTKAATLQNQYILEFQFRIQPLICITLASLLIVAHLTNAPPNPKGKNLHTVDSHIKTLINNAI